MGSELKKKNYMFDHTHKYIKRWEVIVISIACMNCFQVPLEIAMTLDAFESNWYKALSFLIDLVFLIDILINFNMTIDLSESVVYDRKATARAYLRGRFTVDFLSAFPLDVFAKFATSGRVEGSNLRLFSLLKLIRMLRLSRMLRAMNVNRALKVQIKVMTLMFKLILLCHCMACVLMLVIDLEGLWDHPAYMRMIQTSYMYASNTEYDKYLVCLYLSLL